MGMATRAAPRLLAAVGVALLHLCAYLVVTRVNQARPPTALRDLSVPLDAAIPHLPGTWPLYWLVYVFVPLGGGLALWRLPQSAYQRAVVAFAAITVIGASVQLLVPSHAPWPESPAPIQRLYHTSGLVLPYANLPSMHVAFATLTAAILASVTVGFVGRVAAVTVAGAITTGTLTLKEHFVLDAAAGVLLAVAAWLWWRRGTAGGVAA